MTKLWCCCFALANLGSAAGKHIWFGCDGRAQKVRFGTSWPCSNKWGNWQMNSPQEASDWHFLKGNTSKVRTKEINGLYLQIIYLQYKPKQGYEVFSTRRTPKNDLVIRALARLFRRFELSIEKCDKLQIQRWYRLEFEWIFLFFDEAAPFGRLQKFDTWTKEVRFFLVLTQLHTHIRWCIEVHLI